MKPIKYFLNLALLLYGMPLCAQYHYAEGHLRPDREWVFKPEETDNIGQVLVSGYLNGKITAYSFMSRDSLVKFAVVPRDLPAWKAEEKYYMDDWVEYNGSDYALVIDDVRSKISPDKDPDKWARLNPNIEPISILRLPPTEKDTLAKANFLKRLVITDGMTFPAWSGGYDYYITDVVYYNGINYEALQDHKGVIPGSNPDIWLPTRRGDPEIRDLRDIYTVGILYNYSLSHGDTTWNPQFVIAKLYNPNLGFHVPVAYFKYGEVIRYLNSIPQPIPGSNEFAAHSVDFTFCITHSNSQNILHWLKDVARLDPKVVAKGVSEFPLYQEWLNDTVKTRPPYDVVYTVMQHVASGDLLLSKIVGNAHRPFLVVTLNDLRKLSGGQSKPFVPSSNFGTSIADRGNFEIREHKLDSLAPMNPDPVTATRRNNFFFVERYTAKISDQKIKDLRLNELWRATCKLYAEKKLKESRFPSTYYPDEHDWSKEGQVVLGGFTYTFDHNTSFNSAGDAIQYQDSLACDKLDELEVYYERDYSAPTDKKKKFRPVLVTFTYDANLDSKWPESATFDWTELKAALGANYKTFIDAVENGQLSFYKSRVVYGLRER